MESKYSSKRMPCGGYPDFGAIFMSNGYTSKECLKKQLFGLPSVYSPFVRNVRAGMILFLFEYEKRLLHGVFKATSDGRMDIIPKAYSSTGKLFPAQVRIATLWHCHPISENQFRDAIKENYYTPYKFNFGLSKNQVYKLLCLFDGRRDKIPKNVSRVKNENRKQISTTRREHEDKSNVSAKRKLDIDSNIQSVVSFGAVSSSECDVTEKLNSSSESFTENPKKLKLSTEITIQEPEKLKISSKEILGDFIAFSTSDDSDTEEGEISFSEAACFRNSTKESTNFESLSNLFGLPMPNIAGEFHALESSAICLPKEGDNLNEKDFRLKSEVIDPGKRKESDNIRHAILPSGLYSDKLAKKSDVFSRLGFPSKAKSKTSLFSRMNFEPEATSIKKADFTKEGNASAQTKHGNKMGKMNRDKSVKEILKEVEDSHKKWGEKVKRSNFFEQQDESSTENNRISVFSRLRRNSKSTKSMDSELEDGEIVQSS